MPFSPGSALSRDIVESLNSPTHPHSMWKFKWKDANLLDWEFTVGMHPDKQKLPFLQTILATFDQHSPWTVKRRNLNIKYCTLSKP